MGKELSLFLDEIPNSLSQKATELLNIANVKYKTFQANFDEDWPRRPFLSDPEYGLGAHMNLEKIREFARLQLFDKRVRDKYFKPEQASYKEPFYPAVLCLDDNCKEVYKGHIDNSPVPLKEALSWNWYAQRTEGRGFNHIYGWDLGGLSDALKKSDKNGLMIWPKAPAALFPDEMERFKKGENKLILNEESIPGGYGVSYDAIFVKKDHVFRIYAYFLD